MLKGKRGENEVLWATAGDAKVDERRSGDRVGVSQYPRIRGFSCSAELLTLHWDACLWQVQLETFGAASSGGPILRGWPLDVEPEPAEPALPSVSLITSAIRRRLDVRYRVETCVLAIKRLEALGEEWRGGGRGRVGARPGRKSAEKMRWLHEICKQWSHGG